LTDEKFFSRPRFKEIGYTLQMMRKSRVTMGAVGVVISAYAIAILAPFISPYNPDFIQMSLRLGGPSWAHPLGLDQVGRDVLSRLIWGSQVSMLIGIIVVVLSVAIGLPVGAIAGYFGKRVDEVIMRITDIVMSFPGIVLAILIAYILGRGPVAAFIALSLVNWTAIARITRGVVLLEKEKEYTTAAQVTGKSNFSILFGEILPNSIQPVIVWGSMALGDAIVSLAGLSFIGVGVQPPTADWGIMIADGYSRIVDQPLLAIAPGVVIIVVVLSFNLIGDALQDALDPRQRRELR
jgi:peptide/nickel transport system permease protein